REHEMRVAGVEAVRDATAGPVEYDALTPDRPLAGEGPVVEAQPLEKGVGAAVVEALAAGVAQIGLGRAQLLPVGLGLHAGPFDGDELALDAEQLLDHALRLLVATLAEVMVADDPLPVDEIERRPV